MNPSQTQPARRKAPRLLSLLLATLLAGPLLAQTGPAGVGNTASNIVWFDAGRLTGLAEGARLAQWPDVSGNGWHANQTNTVAYPSYRTNALNGKPVIRFDRSAGAQFFEITSPGIGAAMSNSNTVFVVAKANTGATGTTGPYLYQTVWGVIGHTSGVLFYGNPTTTDLFITQWAGGVVPGSPAPPGALGTTTPIQQGVWQLATQVNRETTAGLTLSAFNNGTSFYTGATAAQMTNYNQNLVRIGGTSTYYGWPLNGDVAEIIAYNTHCNDAQRTVVENYLSAKYNLPIANKYYADNSTYNQDVQGIGTTDGVVKHSQAGNGKGLMLSELNGSLDGPTAEFLFAGHNSPRNAVVSNTSAGPVAEQWQRSWYVQKTGIIDAKLSFDWSESGLAATDLTGTYADYVLLYRPDLQSNFVPVTDGNTMTLAAVLENGDQLSFALPHAWFKNGYYTIGKTFPNTWKGLVSADWHTAGNWSGKSVPTTGQQAQVGTCTTCPELEKPAEVGDLLLKGGQVTLKGFAIKASGEVRIMSAKVFSQGGTIQAGQFADVSTSTFQGDITLRRTGRGNNNWGGGNTFSGRFNLENQGTAPIAPATLANDVFTK